MDQEEKPEIKRAYVFKMTEHSLLETDGNDPVERTQKGRLRGPGVPTGINSCVRLHYQWAPGHRGLGDQQVCLNFILKSVGPLENFEQEVTWSCLLGGE